ncbi:MAG: 6-phosphofructokinase [Firmicutes bacterium]|nr:6-phosphofructokinase [Bacillota bacterium]
MDRIGVLTSGGDSPGMNAAIRAVVRCGIAAGMEVFGIERGYEGLMEGDIRQMDITSVGDILHRGGTILKTARSKKFMTEEGLDQAVRMLENYKIRGLVIIGGDGTLRGGCDLSDRGITVMCLPSTIDNDVGYTDYTIGFDTAVNTVLSAISKIRDTSSSHERTTVIEVMGRECGDIALYSALSGGAESVLIPEIPVDINEICRKLLQGRSRGKQHSIIIKAEGVDIPSTELVEQITEKTGQEAKLVILAYLQRGGSPTAQDRILASLLAEKAVQLLRDDADSRAIGKIGDEIVAFDLKEALAMENPIDKRLIELADILSR